MYGFLTTYPNFLLAGVPLYLMIYWRPKIETYLKGREEASTYWGAKVDKETAGDRFEAWFKHAKRKNEESDIQIRKKQRLEMIDNPSPSSSSSSSAVPSLSTSTSSTTTQVSGSVSVGHTVTPTIAELNNLVKDKNITVLGSDDDDHYNFDDSLEKNGEETSSDALTTGIQNMDLDKTNKSTENEKDQDDDDEEDDVSNTEKPSGVGRGSRGRGRGSSKSKTKYKKK